MVIRVNNTPFYDYSTGSNSSYQINLRREKCQLINLKYLNIPESCI